MKHFIIVLVMAFLVAAARAQSPKPVAMIGMNAEKEKEAWANEILGPLNVEWTDSSDWVDPGDWNKYSVVILVGKMPGRIGEEESAKVEGYLEKGGIVVTVATALSAALFTEAEPFSSKFPEYTRTWIGAERCFYRNDGWTDYGPLSSAWPWESALSFQPEAFGRFPYGMLNLSTADNIIGTDKGSVLAVNRVGPGAFIFIGQNLSRVTDRQSYISIVSEAFKTFESTIRAGR